MKLIDAREREFFKHIAKNRVDPSYQSPTNPIPDFYGLYLINLWILHALIHVIFMLGEKIGSLHQYRQVRYLFYFSLTILTFDSVASGSGKVQEKSNVS
jgi:hypothetical protein